MKVSYLSRPVCAAGATVILSAALFLSNANAQSTGYWHTSGNQILDASNTAVRMSGVNWYGFETTDAVVHGLSVQDYHTILNAIKSNGYNVIRIPFSNQVVEHPVIPSSVGFNNSGGAINTDLRGLNSLQILDKIVAAAGQIGLHVILDDHRSSAGNSTETGLWYTSAYPESAWIKDWQALTNRYLNNSTVIGVDLRNEPHDANNNGSCWGCGSTTNDWRLAAERGGNAVLAINPHLLIFVEGTDAFNNDYDWWGGNLEGVQNYPVVLSVVGQLVYSAHDYGPNLSAQSWFNSSTTASSLASTWTKFWAYLSINGIAPVWVGEFGTTNNAGDIQNSVAGSQGQWFQSLVGFLKQHPAIDWTYWALNGEDSYALLDNNYDPTPASALKQQMLAGIQGSQSGGSTGGGTGGGTGNPPPATSCHVTYSNSNDWKSGFGATITVGNTGSSAVNGWTLTWTWSGNQQITQSWGATYTQKGTAVSLSNASYDGSIPAGASVSNIGFNANYSGANVAPTAFYLNGTLCK